MLFPDNLAFSDGVTLCSLQETSLAAVSDTIQKRRAVEFILELVEVDILHFVCAKVSLEESAHL